MLLIFCSFNETEIDILSGMYTYTTNIFTLRYYFQGALINKPVDTSMIYLLVFILKLFYPLFYSTGARYFGN